MHVKHVSQLQRLQLRCWAPAAYPEIEAAAAHDAPLEAAETAAAAPPAPTAPAEEAADAVADTIAVIVAEGASEASPPECLAANSKHALYSKTIVYTACYTYEVTQQNGRRLNVAVLQLHQLLYCMK